MKTVLVLIDFSYSAFNAARYAVMLAGNSVNCRVILYHSIVRIPVVSDGLLSIHLDVSMNKLEDVEISLEPYKKPDTIIECRTDQQELIYAVASIINDESVDLIVAGGKGKSAGQFLLGSNLIDLISEVTSPLLVIPSEAIYEPVQAAIFACDLGEVEKIPVTDIRRFIHYLQCKLYILNVDQHERERVDIEKLIQQKKLHELMDAEHPEYHYTNNKKIEGGILRFCNLYEATLLIVVHKKHGFLHNIIHKSIAKKLAVDTSIPMLILSETD